MRRASALLLSLALTAACGTAGSGGGLTAAPTARSTPVAATARAATPTVAPTATPQVVCPQIPGPPAAKATIELQKGGSIVIGLRADKAPRTVSIFASKARGGMYDGLTFHRVEPSFVIQGGDPLGTGTGGGKQCTELSDLPFTKGAVGIARGGDIAVSNDAQFFVCIGMCLFLNGMYTNFGQVISGQEVADAVKVGDKIKTIRIE